mmetsp:Transcript_69451/g.103392  ORF Transcript_69451/g.103392 Transcript_69451/m.103392 type:complete len:82 (+) Transcript_69451:400-645(+)
MVVTLFGYECSSYIFAFILARMEETKSLRNIHCIVAAQQEMERMRMPAIVAAQLALKDSGGSSRRSRWWCDAIFQNIFHVP